MSDMVGECEVAVDHQTECLDLAAHCQGLVVQLNHHTTVTDGLIKVTWSTRGAAPNTIQLSSLSFSLLITDRMETAISRVNLIIGCPHNWLGSQEKC